jgi:hypothetical protein
MPDVTQSELNDLGFEWSVPKARLERRFRELEEYIEKHGDTEVPHRCDEYPRVGNCVYRQRTARKYGKCPPERIKRLDELGFRW